MSQSLSQSYNQVRHLVPNYEWTTIIKSGDLIHVPSNITLSCDIDGYCLSNGAYFWDPICGEVPHTTDVSVAVIGFVVEVIRHLATELINELESK